MKETDRVRLQHMRDYAREVVSFSSGGTRNSLDHDLMRARALAYSTGIIGEAASHISPALRELHPEIPWRSIIAMRNFLIHEYMAIDLDLLWDTVTKSVPELLVLLEPLLAEADDETSKE